MNRQRSFLLICKPQRILAWGRLPLDMAVLQGDILRHDLGASVGPAALEQIRGQVHPQTWQAFWKVVVEGKTPEEVGEDLSMRPGTVRVAKSRVLSRLRSELGEFL